MGRALPEREMEDHSPPTESLFGWSNLAKALQEVDRAKIQDCKEDIDTLLVVVSLHFDLLLEAETCARPVFSLQF